jgi:hypothetical protein
MKGSPFRSHPFAIVGGELDQSVFNSQVPLRRTVWFRQWLAFRFGDDHIPRHAPLPKLNVIAES